MLRSLIKKWAKLLRSRSSEVQEDRRGAQTKSLSRSKRQSCKLARMWGGEKGLVGYLERLAVENSSAYAGLLAKILPHQLAASADSHGGGRTEIVFRRIIVHPGGRQEIEGVTPKAL